ncbi:hypothetical protein BDY17DRAFT_251198 [Neohortaea acidophila]|uniref:mRNA 3'-end-processing protein n=1 Tax=Neohortaea acidophila TaxID=245834 RepID=A0A6A6PRY2_9PEZI|nr:uncharacterized protein BDY17DRAFT_251198 [Neohortaea acidophila]KAF2482233.1 hypothetical protein BDY17DRAFT_251198 [Neohortaea acidophila]
MATETVSLAPSDQVIQPERAPPPAFHFDAFLKQSLPSLGAPSKVGQPICQDFVKGHCPRGAACPDRHYVPKEERSGIGHLICKHYQRGLCKKGEQCEFAHTFNLRDERECKEFSRWGICPQGDDCTYLHTPPTSHLRLPACLHYARGFCPLGPYCALRHIRHKQICPYYLAGFCPLGRAHPPDRDNVIECQYGAHPKWTKDEDMNPKRPEVRKLKDPEQERKEQEEREEEFFAEEERRRERYERGEGGAGRWSGRGGPSRRRGGRAGIPSGRRY